MTTQESTYDPDAATILAVAEDERHTLLAQAARNHMSAIAAEMSRYAAELAQIENVFQSRITPLSGVPEWINVNRKADIAQALRLVDAASAEDTAALISKTDIPAQFGPMTPAELRFMLAIAASEPDRVYRAWQVARQLLQAAGQ
jgi:hypothetical protein